MGGIGNTVDALINVILGLSALLGLARGLTREALSLLTWIGAAILALHFGAHALPVLLAVANGFLSVLPASVAVYLQGIHWQPWVQDLIARILTFIILLFLGTFLANLVCARTLKRGFRGVDRLMGLAFGIVRGLFIAGTGVWLGAQLSLVYGQTAWQHSWWVQRLLPRAQILIEHVPALKKWEESLQSAQQPASEETVGQQS